MLIIVQTICLLVAIYSFVILFRNNRVARYRSDVLDKVSFYAKQDIKNNMPWQWRFKYFENAVTYQEMVFKFWKPINSFYKDTSFIEAPVKDGKLKNE